jgi:hypothetical protein
MFETWAPTTCIGIGSLNFIATFKKLSIHIKSMTIVCFQFPYIIYVCYNLHMYVKHIITISLQNVNFTSIIWKYLKDYIRIIKKSDVYLFVSFEPVSSKPNYLIPYPYYLQCI